MNSMPAQQDFLPLVDQPFTVTCNQQHQTMQLTSVSELRHSGGYDSFSLTLRGLRRHALDQGVYQLSHEQICATHLLLVPIGATEDSIDYQVVFSRRHEVA